jgi:hypothetical protein
VIVCNTSEFFASGAAKMQMVMVHVLLVRARVAGSIVYYAVNIDNFMDFHFLY